MADFIDLAKPLQLTTPGTAPIAGLTVADTAALEAIESPWPGMFVYVQADGKTYRVTELKEVTVGVFTKMAVKSYEPVPDNAALAEAGARPATIALPVPRGITLVPVESAAEMAEAPVGGEHYHALYAVGFVLFMITFVFNFCAWYASRRLGLKR